MWGPRQSIRVSLEGTGRISAALGQPENRNLSTIRHGNRILPCLSAREEPVATVAGWIETEHGSRPRRGACAVGPFVGSMAAKASTRFCRLRRPAFTCGAPLKRGRQPDQAAGSLTVTETPAEARTQGPGGFARGGDADTAANRLAAARSRGQRTGGGCRGAAAGGGRGGATPWHLPDLDLAEEDRVLSLVKPQDGSPGLRIAAARVLAPQLRTAVEDYQQRVIAAAGRSRACPFDLHALLPVPYAHPRQGPDDPASIAWLRRRWGTIQSFVRNPPRRDTGCGGGAAPPSTTWRRCGTLGSGSSSGPQLGLDVFARRPAAVPREGGYVALMEACLVVLRGRDGCRRRTTPVMISMRETCRT